MINTTTSCIFSFLSSLRYATSWNLCCLDSCLHNNWLPLFWVALSLEMSSPPWKLCIQVVCISSPLLYPIRHRPAIKMKIPLPRFQTLKLIWPTSSFCGWSNRPKERTDLSKAPSKANVPAERTLLHVLSVPDPVVGSWWWSRGSTHSDSQPCWVGCFMSLWERRLWLSCNHGGPWILVPSLTSHRLILGKYLVKC